MYEPTLPILGYLAEYCLDTLPCLDLVDIANNLAAYASPLIKLYYGDSVRREVLEAFRWDAYYGIGYDLNRQVQFFRPKGPNTIQAQIIVLSPGAGRVISTIAGDNISVERESSGSREHTYILGGDLSPSQPLSTLNEQQQDAVLSSINSGGRRIEVINDIGSPSRFETVKSLIIIDPSS